MKPVVLLSLMICGGLAQVTPAPSAPEQQVKPQDQCLVEGSVINSVSREPLKKAHIVLRRFDNNSSGDVPTYGAITESSGHFSIPEIEPGRYSIFVTRTGFTLAKQSGPKKNATPSVLTLNAGQVMKDISFTMAPQAVISGRVVDEDNEPVSYAGVSCMRYQYTSGNKTLRSSGSASTNDKGEFRLFGLSAGKCYISAMLRPNDFGGGHEIRKETGNEQSYVTTYYPSGVSPAAAIAVNVTAGAEVSGIDIRLLRAKSVHISGTVTNLPKLASSVNVTLNPRDNDIWTGQRRTNVDARGRFIIRDLAPGAYTLTATDWQENEARTATTLVDISDSHIEGLQLALGTDPEISGKLVIEGAPAPATGNTAPANVNLMQEEGLPFGNQGGSVKDDGGFVLKSIGAARYRLRVFNLPQGAYVKRVQMGEQEIRGGVIDFRSGVNARDMTITISLNGGQVEGVVRDNDQPSANAAVVLIPGDPALRNAYASVVTDQNGHYIFRGVAPGKYKLYAFDQIENGAYQDSDYMQPYENRGDSIEIAEGARETRDLKIILNDEGGPGAVK